MMSNTKLVVLPGFAKHEERPVLWRPHNSRHIMCARIPPSHDTNETVDRILAHIGWDRATTDIVTQPVLAGGGSDIYDIMPYDYRKSPVDLELKESTVWTIGSPVINKSDGLDANIQKLRTQFGDTFNVYSPSQGITLPVTISLVKMGPGAGSAWQMIHTPRKRTAYLMPMKLIFWDSQGRRDAVKFANITNITSEDTVIVSGSTMVKFCLELLTALGARVATLTDGATVSCAANGNKYDLSVIKLLKEGKSFYARFGFKPKVQNEAGLSAELDELLVAARSIRLSTVVDEYKKLTALLCAAVTDGMDGTKPELCFASQYDPETDTEHRFREATSEDVIELFTECTTVLSWLIPQMSKFDFLHELMVCVFESRDSCSCSDYEKLDMYLLSQSRVHVTYKDTTVSRKYLQPLLSLQRFRYDNHYEYTFEDYSASTGTESRQIAI